MTSSSFQKSLLFSVSKMRWSFFVFVLLMLSGSAYAKNYLRSRESQPYLLPERVAVLPVFVVPRGGKPPNLKQMTRLMQHMQWAQKRYGEMLGGRDTFEIASAQPHVYYGQRDLAFYRKQPQSCAPYWLGELLQNYGQSRFTCPYVFVAVVMNPRDGFPGGGGRPINGGLNTGGGIVIVSSRGLMSNKSPFQSTLQHELGHAFGLLHIDAYGYDMKSNASIMSYNKDHHTRGLMPAKQPGILVPEDIRALALNHRVFHRLKFDPAKDVPKDYSIKPGIPCIGPMQIPGQVDNKVLAKTSAGEMDKSLVSNLAGGKVKSSQSQFDPKTMWASEPSTTGWVTVELEFPMPVRLGKIEVHSQCADRLEPAYALGIQAKLGGKFRTLAHESLKSVDDAVSFRPIKATTWRLHFQTGQNGKVVLRGLRFFSNDSEIFPPLLPRFSDTP